MCHHLSGLKCYGTARAVSRILFYPHSSCPPSLPFLSSLANCHGGRGGGGLARRPVPSLSSHSSLSSLFSSPLPSRTPALALHRDHSRRARAGRARSPRCMSCWFIRSLVLSNEGVLPAFACLPTAFTLAQPVFSLSRFVAFRCFDGSARPDQPTTFYSAAPDARPQKDEGVVLVLSSVFPVPSPVRSLHLG